MPPRKPAVKRAPAPKSDQPKPSAAEVKQAVSKGEPTMKLDLGKMGMAVLVWLRGLVSEKKKDGHWGPSKTNIALWPVLIHCLMVWGDTASQAVESAKKVADEAGVLDSLSSWMSSGGVSAQEYGLLLALLGVSAVKKVASRDATS